LCSHSSDGILDVSTLLGSDDIGENAEQKRNKSAPITPDELEAFAEVKKLQEWIFQ
jgi:hypothetical protein